MAPAVHDSGLSVLAAGKIVKLNRHKPFFHLRPGGDEEYRRWLPIIAAARLS